MLLRRPWKFDKKKQQHDGYTNKYTFLHKDPKFTLVPLSPKEVCEYKYKMRENKRTKKKKKVRKCQEKPKRKIIRRR